MFEQLRNYSVIGWDVDDTILDHARQNDFWRFIIDNPYDQEHHIVTFRSGGMERSIFHELMIAGSRLRRDHFAGVHSIPHSVWVANETKIIILGDGNSDPYCEWKGLTCAENGINVLIDDAHHIVADGCAKHNVDHFHPDDLI